MLIAIKNPGESIGFKVESQVTLKYLQELVGGYIEICPTREMKEKNILMIVNEEGKLNGLPVNFKIPGDTIVGTVVFMSSTGEEFGSLDENQVNYLKYLDKIFYVLEGAK